MHRRHIAARLCRHAVIFAAAHRLRAAIVRLASPRGRRVLIAGFSIPQFRAVREAVEAVQARTSAVDKVARTIPRPRCDHRAAGEYPLPVSLSVSALRVEPKELRWSRARRTGQG